MSLRRRPGEFWGRGETAREAGGFRFQILRATAREEEVHTHSHDEAHFVLVLGGAYISSAEGAPELSATPMLVFNPPDVVHRDRFLHGRGAFMAVTVGGAAARRLRERRGSDRAVAVADPDAIAAARALARGLAAESPLALEGRAWALAGAMEGVAPDGPPPWLTRAFEMIWTSQDPSLTVADVAADAGVHPVHLARVFQRRLGCAPGELLRGRRLERAAHAIGAGAASLADAAADLGFVDQSHLTRSFQAAFGLTPGRYRRARQVSRIQDGGPRPG